MKIDSVAVTFRSRSRSKKALHRDLKVTATVLGMLTMCVSSCALTSLLFGGDSTKPNPDEFRIGRHEWVGDSIIFSMYRKSDSTSDIAGKKIEIECKSCNLYNPPFETQLGADRTAHIYITETR